jgi:D-cysteine desulfhydrase
MPEKDAHPRALDGEPIPRRLFTAAALATLIDCSAPRPYARLPPPPVAPPLLAPITPAPPLALALDVDVAPHPSIERPLLRTHPALRELLPWVSLGTFPTPLEHAVDLGRHLGVRSLWVKRDDLSGQVHGGGKVRKLELLLGAARSAGARTVVTFGGVGSNHAVATAIYASQLGMHALLVLLPEPADERVRRNLRADLAAGAEVRLAHGHTPSALTARRDASGEPPPSYTIAAGGTSPLGNVGFVNAAFELAEQIARGEMPEPDVVYLAMGTMGAAVGLAVGLRAAGLGSRVVAVRASSPGTSSAARMRALETETEAYLHALDPSFHPLGPTRSDVVVAGGYLGAGYGRATEKGRRAMGLAHDLAGLDLEHVYTGKALAALVDDAPRLADKVVLFWNTHNSRPLPLGDAAPRDLPAELRGYLVGWPGPERSIDAPRSPE